MKTAFGKLTLLAVAISLALMLIAPMRSGIEDALLASVSAVTLDPGEATNVGYTLRADAAQTVAYRSDDRGVAKVDQRGNITAVSPGRTKVRLIAQGGATAIVDVTVSGTPITSFALNTHSLEMDKGDISGLSFQVNKGATVRNVSWTSANPEIAAVDGAGRISALGAGETTITAVTPGGLSDSARVRVRVRSDSVAIEPDGLTVGVGAAFRLSARYMPEDATDRVVRWVSSDPVVLAVDDQGNTRAVSVGEASITAITEQGLKTAIMIRVEPASKDFQMSLKSVSIERGDAHMLEANFIGQDGQPDKDINHHIEWTSSDPEVVTVRDGRITGIATGTATVTAASDGLTASCVVHVHTSVREVILNITEETLYREQTGEPFQLKATVLPADADDQTLTFSSDNPLVANVSQNGLVTMTGGYGTAVISVEAASGARATCTVNVVVPAATHESAAAEVNPE